jgi:CCR4-NOT complex subunit CAF16
VNAGAGASTGAPAIPAIEVRALEFAYPDGPAVLRGLDFALAPGARCLLVGANGSGKTTLLNVLAGRHMRADAAARVLGRPVFSDTALAGDVALLGGLFPFDVDLSVDEILARQHGVDDARRERLLGVLGVERGWRMSRVSDGQRRRVQLVLGLLRPKRVLLLDEVTTDLDVLARADLLAFLRDESEQGGATILYATHIFDGLETWATELAHLHKGTIVQHVPIASLAAGAPLGRTMERWLRAALLEP